jgi:hypothetical protein
MVWGKFVKRYNMISKHKIGVIYTNLDFVKEIRFAILSVWRWMFLEFAVDDFKGDIHFELHFSKQ